MSAVPITITPELALLLEHAAQRRRALSGGAHFGGRTVTCSCGHVYPFALGRCERCTAPVEHSVPNYRTMTLPARLEQPS